MKVDHDEKSTFDENQIMTYLLDRVAEFAAGKLVPETFHGGKVGSWDVLDLGPVNEVASLLLGTSQNDQCIAGELQIEGATKKYGVV